MISTRTRARARGVAQVAVVAAAAAGFLAALPGPAHADDCQSGWSTTGIVCNVDVYGGDDDPIYTDPWGEDPSGPPDPGQPGGGGGDPGGGGGGGGSSGSSDAQTVTTAVGRAQAALAPASTCNALLSGLLGDAATILDNTIRDNRLRWASDGREPFPEDPYAYAATNVFPTDLELPADQRIVYLFSRWFTGPFEPSFSNSFQPPLTAEEFQEMGILHELAHLTRSLTHGPGESTEEFNTKIVRACIRPGS